MTRLKKFFGVCEKEAYKGILMSCSEEKIDAFAKVRVSDIVVLDHSGLSDAEFDYATRAHFDFVLCHQNDPQLTIEFDFQERDELQSKQAKLKDRICADLDVPFLRVDGTRLDRSLVSTVVKELLNTWKAPGDLKLLPKVNGCSLHSGCDISKCKDFQETGAWLFVYEGIVDFMDEIEPHSIRVEIETYENRGSYFQSSVTLRSGKLKLKLGFGRCHCSEQFRGFGKRVSMQLALWMHLPRYSMHGTDIIP